nr:tol-Pal system protein TolA-like [Aegilops tauschii subsp. strangulata]
MRLRPGLDHNLMVMRHAHLCQRHFQLDMNRDGEVEQSGKAVRTAVKAGKVAKGAHVQVQEFFDTLHEGCVTAKLGLVQDTSQVELDYIAARAAEAKLTEEASSAGGVEDRAAAEAEEKELAAEAEAKEIATKEAAKGAADDTAKDSAGEPGKGLAGEASKSAAEEDVVDDQPSSSAASGSGRYLKVSDDLFVHLLGTSRTRAPVEVEVFNDEVLATAGLEVVDEPSAGSDGSQEERLLHVMGASFRKH